MERLGTCPDARDKALSDIRRLLTRIQAVARMRVDDVAQGIDVLKKLRAETYEDLNQIQHEYMILCSAEWLIAQKRCPPDTIWSWNPRQTGGADEPDLRGELSAHILLSAEISRSGYLPCFRFTSSNRVWSITGDLSSRKDYHEHPPRP